MKYMNQRTFDAFALRTFIMKVTNESGVNFSNLVSEYYQMFNGDFEFLPQAIEVADKLIQEWPKLSVNEQVKLATKLMMIRKELDDNMDKKFLPTIHSLLLHFSLTKYNPTLNKC